MTRIDSIFADLRARGQRALMPFICGGHPHPGGTGDLLRACQRGGASIVEVGIPFSDPVADGPVIAAAMHNALQAGVTPASVLDQVAAARADLSIGIVAMCSVSIALKMGGPGGFASRLKESGFDGIILPDVPVEEATPYLQSAREAGLSASLLIAPTTPFKRAQIIAEASTGFVYLLTRTGITGASAQTPDMGPRIERLRTITQLPIACGFGISTPDQVASVVRHADAAIVGSALVRRLSDAAAHGADPLQACEHFVRELASGLAAPFQG
ncbi:MAG TPA: tryptophan synthase subunit alpha [Phycisphaerales bacterium]|nr:tryptophan synthase subunit alpha [Phycisphaerales bacterium]